MDTAIRAVNRCGIDIRFPMILAHMKRRALLLLGATSLFGGCLGDGEKQARARLAWIWLQNDREEAYDVEVVVEANGRSVFSETYRLGTTPDTANITENRPVEEPGHYVVRATMDGETREVDITEYVDGEENCIGVRFSLRNNGSVDYWTKSMKQC
jgi:hypothetical protein